MEEDFEVLREEQKLSEALKTLNSHKKVIIIDSFGRLKVPLLTEMYEDGC